MHSWYRPLVFRSLVLPAAGITISFGETNNSGQQQKRRSSPTLKTKFKNNDTSSPIKQWPPSTIVNTLVTSDQFVDSSNSTNNHAVGDPDFRHKSEELKMQQGWFSPLTSCNNAFQITPLAEEEVNRDAAVRENNHLLVFSATTSSLQQGAEGLSDGSLTTNASSTQIEELVMNESENKEAPLIILFGWAGCRDRYLSKYSSYYQKEGCSVARFTAPISKIRSFSSYRKFALEIYEKVLEQEPKRPIIFHMFSMNGCSLFTALWDLLDNVSDGAEIKQRVHGLIFDSSPANVLPWQAANAISFATFPQGKYRIVPREAYRLFLAGIFSVHRAFVWLQSNFNDKTYEKHFAYFRLQCFDDLPKNQLYLYSDADDICVRESIELFQEVQRKQQANVKPVCWTDSEHCQHYRRYENEYTKQCLEFVRNTLRKPVNDAPNNVFNFTGLVNALPKFW